MRQWNAFVTCCWAGKKADRRAASVSRALSAKAAAVSMEPERQKPNLHVLAFAVISFGTCVSRRSLASMRSRNIHREHGNVNHDTHRVKIAFIRPTSPSV